MLTPKKQKVLATILSCKTLEEASRTSGISTRTLRNYMADEEFKQEYIKRCSGMVADATRIAQQSLCPSINTLRDIIEDDKQPVSARIQASRILIDTSVKLTEIYDLQARIEALEKMYDSEENL